jgi:hypothetical protein
VALFADVLRRRLARVKVDGRATGGILGGLGGLGRFVCHAFKIVIALGSYTRSRASAHLLRGIGECYLDPTGVMGDHSA